MDNLRDMVLIIAALLMITMVVIALREIAESWDVSMYEGGSSVLENTVVSYDPPNRTAEEVQRLSYEARQSGLDAGIEMMTEKIDILQANNPEYKTLIGMYTTDKLWFEYLKETDDQTRNRREWEQTEKAAIEAKGGKVFDRPDCGY